MLKLLFCVGLVMSAAAARPAWAQQPAAPAADTVGREKFTYAKGTNRYYWGTLTKADGTQVPAYLPTRHVGYAGRITYFLPPLSVTNELRNRHGINIKEMQAITVRGRQYESIRLNGKPIDILAVRLLDGPVTLATYAEARAIPLPIPLGAGLPMPIAGFRISDKNHWYLRRDGAWTEIGRADFATALSAYLADAPELAAKVARQEPNYLHLNTPAIIAKYNQLKQQ